jgi:dephospho-CoA kinase
MILGITGTLGSGKGTVVDYLVDQKGYKRFAVSDTFLASEAVKRGLEPDRQARHDIANEYRALGPTKLQEAVYDMAKSDIEAGHDVIIEPQHTVGEVHFIQSLGGKVIGIDADIHTRYERIQRRGSAKDNVSFEEFRDFEQLESQSDDPNKQNLIAAGHEADVHIRNDGTLDDLHHEIEVALEKLG